MSVKPDNCRERWAAARARAELMFDVMPILARWSRNDPCWAEQMRRTARSTRETM